MTELVSDAIVLFVSALAVLLAAHALVLGGAQARGLRLLMLLLLLATLTALLVEWVWPQGALGLHSQVLAAGLFALLYLHFARAPDGRLRLYRRDLLQLLPPLVMLVLTSIANERAVAMLMLLLALGYGLGYLSLRRSGALAVARQPGGRLLAALALLLLAVCQIIVTTEAISGVALQQSRPSRLVVVLSVAVVLWLFAWAWRDPEWVAHALGSLRERVYQWQASPAHLASESERATAGSMCRRLDHYLRDSRAYAEFGVSLDLLAERLEMPARQLALAVNRMHGRSVHTLLNDWKVADAVRQLEDPAMAAKPIAEVMFDAGFQTRWNFHKEFSRRLGMPPEAYRQQRRR